MKKYFGITLISFLFLSTGFSPSNYVVDFDEVLKTADFYRGGQVPGISWDVDVRNYEQGKDREDLDLLVEAASEGERQFTLVTFLSPQKYEGQVFLVRDNNMWFMKPNLRRPVPISGRQRLSGTASNTDVASVNYYNDYNIAETSEGEYEGEPCWILDLEAKNNLVSYAKVKYWISKSESMGLKAEFRGKSGKLIKYAYFEYENDVTYKSKKSKFISKVAIFDGINKEDKTTLYISKVKFPSYASSKFQKNNLID